MKSEFKAATLRQFSNMRSRFSAKYDEETGTKLVRPAREIPFSLEQYREWVLGFLRSERGLRCSYCDRALEVDVMSPDHDVPTKRGGGLALSNLCPSCKLCNQRKGELTGKAFKALLKGLETFPEADRSYILKSLASAAMGARLRFFPREQKSGIPRPPKKQPSVRFAPVRTRPANLGPLFEEKF